MSVKLANLVCVSNRVVGGFCSRSVGQNQFDSREKASGKGRSSLRLCYSPVALPWIGLRK